ncbi:pro-resilin [Orussus abietinus]|uniref:pro-resilin n=1 Tax=Orussus abietinus TaxID=222816 RepID=UPI0006251AB7|nr:pro-resilin [Orussus abietinus]
MTPVDFLPVQVAVLSLLLGNVLCDLPPGTRRNTYLPPEPTKGYTYNKPPVPFPSPTPTFPGRPTPTFPVGPTRPTPTFPTGPPRPPTGYPTPGPRPTPGFPDYPGQPTGHNGNTIGPGPHDHHHHEPGMPFDFNYAVKEDAFGNDYSHNAISDGDIVRGEYRVQLPDGRLQIVRYTADWKNGFNAQVSYEGVPRFDLPGGNFNQGY